MAKKSIELTPKQVGLFLTFFVLLANLLLAFAGIPSTLSCTLAHASAEAQEIIAEVANK